MLQYVVYLFNVLTVTSSIHHARRDGTAPTGPD